jgi:alkanesulfonate monooxygenase SsuD/methylene tetrahydromethanopterin reductase-like flavin-dependent oxidoreductase (luciferase family)
VKGRAEKAGRSRDDLKILPGCFVVIGETVEQPREKRAKLDSLVHFANAIGSLTIALGHDASKFDPDGPLPEIPESNASKSGRQRDNNETRIAMERGEVQASVAPATLFNGQLKPWLEQGKVRIVVQYADFRHPGLPDVPTIVEVAETQEATAVFKFLVSLSTLGRAYGAPPSVPAETLAILRNAFQAIMADPAFRKDAEKRDADVLPGRGQYSQH